jgi:hypothetical protein
LISRDLSSPNHSSPSTYIRYHFFTLLLAHLFLLPFLPATLNETKIQPTLKAGREGGREDGHYLVLLKNCAALEQPTHTETGREGERRRNPFPLFFPS